MKKVLSFILCFCLALTLASCITIGADETKSGKKDLSSRIEKIYGDESVRIYVDTETKIMYLFIKSGYSGGLTIMLDENGNPLLWDESGVRE